MSRNKTSDFLAAMTLPQAAPVKPPRPKPARKERAARMSAATTPAATSKPVPERHHSRVDRKHFGGYLDDETLEIAAVLRVRLKMDNSELIKFALEELDRSHKAKRAFGDA